MKPAIIHDPLFSEAISLDVSLTESFPAVFKDLGLQGASACEFKTPPDVFRPVPWPLHEPTVNPHGLLTTPRGFARSVVPSAKPVQCDVDDRGFYPDRLCRYFYDKMTNQYGRLPPDHPMQLDAERCLVRCRKDPIPSNVRVVVLPEWKAINACVIDDGTIFVSGLLMRSVEYWEELIAVLGHELCHWENGDTKRHENKWELESLEKLAEDWLKRTSVLRLQEYRGDLEGSAQKLDEAGVNPEGLRVFLFRLHDLGKQRRWQHRSGGVHGKNLDRALLIGGVTHWRHFYSLSHALELISAETLRSWQAKGAMVASTFVFKPYRFLYRDPKERRQKEQARFSYIETLGFDERSQLFQQLLSEFRGEMPEDLVAVVDRLVLFLDRDLTALCTKPDDLPLLRFLHYQLNLGIDLKRPLKRSGDAAGTVFPVSHQKEFVDALGTPAGLERLFSLVLDLQKMPTMHALGNPKQVIKLISDVAVQKGLFGPFAVNEFALQGWCNTFKQWAACLALYSQTHGLQKVSEAELFGVVVAGLRAKAMKKGDEPLMTMIDEFVTAQEPGFSLVHTGNQKDDQIRLRLRQAPLCQKMLAAIQTTLLFRDVEGKGVKQRVARVEDTLMQLSANPHLYAKTFDLVWELVDQKTTGCDIRQVFLVVGEIDNLIEVATYDLVRDYDLGVMQSLLICRVFDRLIETHPAFGALSNLKMIAYRHFACYLAGLYGDMGLYRDIAKRTEQEWSVFTCRQIVALYDQQRDLLLTEGQVCSLDDLRWYAEQIETGFGGIGKQWGQGQWARVKTGCAWPLLTGLVLRISKVPGSQRMAIIRQWEQAGLRFRELLGKRDWHYENPLKPDLRPSHDFLSYVLMRDLEQVPEDDRDSVVALAGERISDPFLHAQVRSFLLAKKWKQARFFEDRMRCAFDDPLARDEMALKWKLIEEEIHTEHEVRAVEQRLQSSFSDLVSEGNVVVGVSAAFDALGLSPKSFAQDLLKLLLMTGQGDKDIKRIVGNERIVSKSRNKETVRREVAEQVAGLDHSLFSLFSLPTIGRGILAKMLLIDGELVINGPKRAKMFSAILEEIMAAPQAGDSLATRMRQLTEALGLVTEWEPLFHAILPTLADHLARPPEQATPWDKVGLDADLFSESGLTPAQAFSQVGVMTAVAFEKPWENTGLFSHEAKKAMHAWLNSQGHLMQRPAEKLAPADLLVEIAPRCGAMAVRFLQLLPQVTDMTEEEEQRYASLCDDLEGQNRLEAIQTMERVWPDMWTHVAEVGKRCGGGSLMTVYRLEMKDGKSLVARVVNPNVDYHLKNTRRLFDEAIAAMASLGHIDKTMQEQLLQLVAMVDEWILAELDFEGFIQRDMEFSALQAGRNFGTGYAIKVPEVEQARYHLEPNSVLQIEEWVAGKDLTEWAALAKAHDMRQVMVLLVKSYADQIKSGLCHGDAHPGNYRVTPDNQVAILDRMLMLRLTEAERSLFGSVLAGRLDTSFYATVAQYFLSLAEKSISPAMQQAILSELMQMASHIGTGQYHRVNASLINLRRLGVKIPLKLSLLLRNIHFYDRMAKRAGFRGFGEALSFNQGELTLIT